MDAAIEHVQAKPVISSSPSEWEEAYRPLPFLFFGLLSMWTVLLFLWTLNTWSKRRWQTSQLQWMLTAVPVLKALVLGLSFVFWYSCLNLSTCSFWVAFGVFVSRIFFETSCFIAFLLIAHGYCIMHEQLTVSERRSIAGLASLLYLTLTGYKAAVPQFAVLVVFVYGLLLYVIMVHIARNLGALREQLQQIQDEGVHMMHTAVYTKYTMFKKFQRAMLMMVVAEILMHARTDGLANEYWMRLLVREFMEIGIFFYIGWTFRSREMTPFFTVIPSLQPFGQRILPPIYSVEINEKQFNNLDHKEWHIGVPTSISKSEATQRPMLVIVQNPGMSDFADFLKEPKKPEGVFNVSQQMTCPSSLPPHSSSPPPLIDHEGLQLRLRSFGDLSSESGSRRESAFPGAVKEGTRSVDGKENRSAVVFVDEVVVDVKPLKSYSFLQFESSCGDSRALHSRSNASMSLQGFAPHQSSIKSLRLQCGSTPNEGSVRHKEEVQGVDSSSSTKDSSLQRYHIRLSRLNEFPTWCPPRHMPLTSAAGLLVGKGERFVGSEMALEWLWNGFGMIVANFARMIGLTLCKTYSAGTLSWTQRSCAGALTAFPACCQSAVCAENMLSGGGVFLVELAGLQEQDQEYEQDELSLEYWRRVCLSGG